MTTHPENTHPENTDPGSTDPAPGIPARGRLWWLFASLAFFVTGFAATALGVRTCL